MSGIFPARSPYDIFRPQRRRVFISYHHANDQWYYNEFSRFFHDGYDAVFDNSIDREIDSVNVNYVIQRIRENFISSTSCTIVLLGAETPQRKYVDWEIKATLEKQHGLLGLILPNCRRAANGNAIVPSRFHLDYTSGHARLANFVGLTVADLKLLVESAVAAEVALIDNSHPMKQKNG